MISQKSERSLPSIGSKQDERVKLPEVGKSDAEISERLIQSRESDYGRNPHSRGHEVEDKLFKKHLTKNTKTTRSRTKKKPETPKNKTNTTKMPKIDSSRISRESTQNESKIMKRRRQATKLSNSEKKEKAPSKTLRSKVVNRNPNINNTKFEDSIIEEVKKEEKKKEKTKNPLNLSNTKSTNIYPVEKRTKFKEGPYDMMPSGQSKDKQEEDLYKLKQQKAYSETR